MKNLILATLCLFGLLHGKRLRLETKIPGHTNNYDYKEYIFKCLVKHYNIGMSCTFIGIYKLSWAIGI